MMVRSSKNPSQIQLICDEAQSQQARNISKDACTGHSQKVLCFESAIGNVSGAPAGIRTPNQQIMKRVEGHQQGQTKRVEAVFTESAAVKVS